MNQRSVQLNTTLSALRNSGHDVTRYQRMIAEANDLTKRAQIALSHGDYTTTLDLASHAYVLETGRVVMSGPAAVVKNDENVRKSYLGY